MSVKKLSFYLNSAQITLRSDHLPLKKFLDKNTMNTRVNSWAVELETQNINFKFIAGTKNVLADTLSRLIELDKSIKLPEEEPVYEFGYTPFEELPPARVTVVKEVVRVILRVRVTFSVWVRTNLSYEKGPVSFLCVRSRF